MASKIKRPGLKRYPKRPKTNTLDAWKRYDEKCREVEKENGRRMTDYHKAVKKAEADKKALEALKKKNHGLSGIAYKGK